MIVEFGPVNDSKFLNRDVFGVTNCFFWSDTEDCGCKGCSYYKTCNSLRNETANTL